MNAVIRALSAALAPAAERLFVGFSGGMDSVVLLHAAVRLAGRRSLCAIHVNHQLHPDAPAWESRCRAVCTELGVALEVRRVQVAASGSVEAAAREARYQVFAELAGQAGGRLLLAHHRGDQVETVLLRLLQGRGLYGMPQRRPLGRGELVRPLLHLPRSELAAYARGEGLDWIDDPANADASLDRNYLRLQVLPGLRERWPVAEDAILQALAERELVDNLLLRTSALDASSPALPRKALAGHPLSDQVVLLRLWLQGRGEPVPSRRALEAFLRQLSSGADRQPALALAGGGSLRRYAGAVHHVPALPQLAAAYPIAAPGVLRLPHGEVRIEPDPAGVALRGSLSIRFRRGGETLRVGGHQRAVKQLLQEAHVAPWQRGHLPLLYDDLGLAAIPGIALRDAPLHVGGGGEPLFAVRWLPDRAFR